MKILRMLLKLLHFRPVLLLTDVAIVVQILVWTVSHTNGVKFAAYYVMSHATMGYGFVLV